MNSFLFVEKTDYNMYVNSILHVIYLIMHSIVFITFNHVSVMKKIRKQRYKYLSENDDFILKMAG